MTDYAALSDTLMRRLGLSRMPIAISLLPDLPPGARLAKPAPFCEMWVKAMDGKTLYLTAKEEECGGAAYHLGLAEAPPGLKNGALFSRTFHNNRTPAAGVRLLASSPTVPQGCATALVCAPLEKADFDVDVVMIVCNPATAMKLAGAIAYDTGSSVSGITGPATCSVAVAGPYVSGKPAFTAADAGARGYMKLSDDEMIVSLPGEMLITVVRNLEEMAQYFSP